VIISSQMMPIVFLRVVAAVAQAVRGRSEQLPALEELPGLIRRGAAEDPGDQHHQQAADDHPDQRRNDDEREDLAKTLPDDRRPRTGLGHRRSDQPTDQRVRRRRRNAVVPGDDVPGQGADQGPEDHVVIDEARVDRPLADRRRHLELKHPEGGKVEERGEQHRLLRGQGTGRDDRRDGVRAIVKPVHEVERQRNCYQQRQRPDAHI
jgi:hypothetical protein